jgi:dTDP-4-amino-4,6-dideoxygalactose transaminase
MRKKIPLYDLTLSQDSIREVNDTLKSGWLASGPKVLRFEKAIAESLHVPHVVAVGSATAGLIVALKALGVQPGSEVITSPFTFIATVEAILHCGATPILADITPETLTIDPISVEKLITKKTSVILPVDIAGGPCDYQALRKISKKHKIPILSDSAHSFGTLYRGKSMPQWADVSVYSFHATKNLTCGEGGVVATCRKDIAKRIRSLTRHGITATAFQRKKSGSWKYDVIELGYKANMADVHAAIGLGELKDFEKRQLKRRNIAFQYDTQFKQLGELIHVPMEQPHTRHAWHLYIIKLNTKKLKINRDQFIKQMADHGIECGVHFTPVFEFSHFRFLKKWRAKCKNSVQAGETVISLPMYSWLTRQQVDYICKCVKTILNRNNR